jgi:regulator of replication initiation timing
MLRFKNIRQVIDISEQIEQIMNQLLKVEQDKQQILEQETELKNRLLRVMQSNRIERLENANMKVNFIKGFNRVTVDSRLLQEKYPDAYRQCARRSAVSPFVKVQVF